MIRKCGIREVRWLAQVVDVDSKSTSFLFLHSSPWSPASGHAHAEFKVSFPALMLESGLRFPLQEPSAETY